MGQDKALLVLAGETLVAHALRSLQSVCEEVAIAGGAAELADFGRVIPDGRPGYGPLGGIVAALEQTSSEWNLFLAVDVPFVPVQVWRALLKRAENSSAICVMAQASGQVQPLCAAYRRPARDALRRELDVGNWKVTAAIAVAGHVDLVEFAEPEWFRNFNTPEDFAAR